MELISARLDRSNPAALHAQLTEYLAGAIADGQLTLGQRLPSERQLAATLGVSRTTVVTAYRELEARGLVRGQVGRGTFVVGDDGGDDDMPFAWRGRLASGARRYLDPSLRAMLATRTPGTVSFGPGQSALDRFPVDTVRRISDDVLRRGGDAVGIVPTEGDPRLRELVAARHGADPSQVLMVSGSQQGLDLIARCLLDPGDVVVMDRPGYLGAVQTFMAAGATVVGWDIERADPEELEGLLLRYAPKLIYTVPTYQNPTGGILPLAHRQELLRLAARHRVPVIEDEPYRELGFAGFAPPPPTLWQLDRHAVVVHLGTFSKTLAAGLRLGWVLAPDAVVGHLTTVKARMDIAGASHSQHVVRELLAGGHYDRHVAMLRREHATRHDVMADALRRHLPPGAATWRPASGGFYLWLRLGAGLDADDLAREGAAAGVTVVPGPPFHPDGGGTNRIRLCFAGSPPADIDTGVRRLASAIAALTADRHATPPATREPAIPLV